MQPTARCDPRTGRSKNELRLRGGVRPTARRLVREHRPRAGAGPRILHLGRVRQLRELPAGADQTQTLLQPGRHLGERTPRAHPQGLYGQPRVVLLRVAGGRRAQILRPEQRPRRVEREEGQPAVDGPTSRRSPSSWPCVRYSTRRSPARMCSTYSVAAVSTLIGCSQTGRKAYLMEIDPLYCDVHRRAVGEVHRAEGGAGRDLGGGHVNATTRPEWRRKTLVGLYSRPRETAPRGGRVAIVGKAG